MEQLPSGSTKTAAGLAGPLRLSRPTDQARLGRPEQAMRFRQTLVAVPECVPSRPVCLA